MTHPSPSHLVQGVPENMTHHPSPCHLVQGVPENMNHSSPWHLIQGVLGNMTYSFKHNHHQITFSVNRIKQLVSNVCVISSQHISPSTYTGLVSFTQILSNIRTSHLEYANLSKVRRTLWSWTQPPYRIRKNNLEYTYIIWNWLASSRIRKINLKCANWSSLNSKSY